MLLFSAYIHIRVYREKTNSDMMELQIAFIITISIRSEYSFENGFAKNLHVKKEGIHIRGVLMHIANFSRIVKFLIPRVREFI